MKASKVLKGAVIATFATLVIAGGAFAAIRDCVGSGKAYPNLAVGTGSSAPTNYPIKCQRVQEKNGNSTTWTTIYGKTTADCAQASSLASNPEGCNGSDLNSIIKLIINAVVFVVGMVSVVMIILGGVNYATSQGYPGKVKKGKDTILYGIIGLVIAILAFAIVNFVLGALQTN